HRCPPNEEWSLCGKICEPRCDNPTPKICPKIACSKNIAACRCKPGHLRNEKNRCVKPEKCKRHCKDDECNPLKSACRCKQGYVRNEQKICVKLEKCKKKKTELYRP
ncbi:PREDICTED: chymotrypsin inhibitor-like, partial [Dufourea novaeangliae]|uniref:chymotrypsin inhibitor-like n=1 Tax=Dufourea novaeangliae TaxID=178035 RepID=UPI0007672DC3